MTQSVQDLISAIDTGDSTEIDAAFNQEMASRISTRIDSMRQDLAKNMFKSNDSEDLSIEDTKDELDIEVQDTADTPIEEPEVVDTEQEV